MFADLSLHLHRLASRRQIRREHLDPVRIEATLRFFVRSLPALLDAERCNVYVYDPVAARAWVEVGTGLEFGASGQPPRNTLAGAVIAAGEPRIANDAASLSPRGELGGSGPGIVARSAACVPIRSRYHGEVIGAIEALNKNGDTGFVPEDLAQLQEAADIVQDLVDSVFLAQKVYGATDAVVTGSRLTVEAATGLALLGSLVTLLVVAAWPSIPLIKDAFDLSLLPFMPVQQP